VRAIIRDVLEEGATMTLGASGAAEAMEMLRSHPVSLMLVDLGHGGQSNLELLRYALRLNPRPVAVVLTERPQEAQARDLMNEGIFDYLIKPVGASAVDRLARRAASHLSLIGEVRALRRELQSREGYHRLVGRSPAMEQLRQGVERVSGSDTPVWVSGPTGSGKKLTAQCVHTGSARSDRPFVVVNCAGIQGDSAGSSADLLLGPLAAQAEGGTLYLDGVTELAPSAQQTLLDALASAALADVRLVAGSVHEADAAAARGLIDPALAQRLSAARLTCTPLAGRREDVALLARYFIETITEINHLPPLHLSSDALSLLAGYHWPGNIQELRNAMEHSVILAADGVIDARELPERIRESPRSADSPEGPQRFASPRFKEAKQHVVSNFERAYLTDLLQHHAGNVTSASQQAGMLRSALQRLLRKYGLKSADYRGRRGERQRSTPSAS
jgi:DNA-binding NtrC family response regulator